MHSIWAFCNVCNIQDWLNIDGLVQERCNSIANAMELHLTYTNRLIWYIDSLVQDCSNSSAWAMELLQSWAKKKNDIKMLSYHYSDSHYKDKMIVRLSYIHMGFTSHVAALYQIRAFKFIQCFFFLNWASHPGGHYWNNHTDALSFKSSLCNICGDQAPINEIYVCPIFNSLRPSDAYMRW